MYSIVFSPAAGGTIQPQRKFNIEYKIYVFTEKKNNNK